MKWARNVNNFAVDVRTTDPDGFFTPEVVAEFIVVPDEVETYWVYNDETQQWEAPPPAPEPVPPIESGTAPNVIE